MRAYLYSISRRGCVSIKTATARAGATAHDGAHTNASRRRQSGAHTIVDVI